MRSASDDRTAIARIRDAAIEQFGEHGFNVGLRTIAEAAGVSAALVIHHFGSKEGLRKACDDYIAEEIREAKSETIRSTDPATWFAQMAEIESYAPMMAYLMRHLQSGTELAKSFWQRMIDNAEQYIEEGVRAGTIKPSRDPRARKPTRRVPIPPELVVLLRAHLERFGTGPDGRLFRSENGNPIQQSTWWQVWQKVRKASLSAEELASPLMRRPYDLRHSGVTWRLNSGVPATEVAAWAGHSVEVLMRVYARCVTGLEDVWIGRMDDGLRLASDRPDTETER